MILPYRIESGLVRLLNNLNELVELKIKKEKAQ